MSVWAVIAAGGIESVTLRAVAAEAGMSLGQVQHYVPNKAELIRLACVAMIDVAAEAFDKAADGDPEVRLRELLVHSFSRSDSFRAGVRVWFAFLAKSADDPDIARLVNDAKAGTETEIARLLVATGRDPIHARSLMALGDGLAERTLTGAITADEAEAEIDRCLTAFPGWLR